MSIEDQGIIDIISAATDGSEVTLTTTDHLQWGDNEHLMLIQEKINSYLAFIESGEIFESYPAANGREVGIEIICKYPPDEEGIIFLDRCKEIIQNAGFLFNYKVDE